MDIFLQFLPTLIRVLKISQFKYRNLTSDEIALCRTVFGELIKYDQIKIMNHPFLPWQHAYIFMAPKGNIHCKETIYKTDYSCENLAYRAIFIHEMTHILQYQRKINVLVKGALLQTAYYLSFKQYNPYKYTLVHGKPFWSYNIEQQGEIARDIYLGKIQNIILKN